MKCLVAPEKGGRDPTANAENPWQVMRAFRWPQSGLGKQASCRTAVGRISSLFLGFLKGGASCYQVIGAIVSPNCEARGARKSGEWVGERNGVFWTAEVNRRATETCPQSDCRARISRERTSFTRGGQVFRMPRCASDVLGFAQLGWWAACSCSARTPNVGANHIRTPPSWAVYFCTHTLSNVVAKIKDSTYVQK
jgi:hypothetical protein